MQNHSRETLTFMTKNVTKISRDTKVTWWQRNDSTWVLSRGAFSVEIIEDLILNSNLPGGVQAILKEKKGDLESAAKILLQEFEISDGVDEQMATLNDFLEFTNRQSQNLTQGKKYYWF